MLAGHQRRDTAPSVSPPVLAVKDVCNRHDAEAAHLHIELDGERISEDGDICPPAAAPAVTHLPLLH